MELAAASEMSLGYRVDKRPTWHPSGAHVTGWRWIAVRRFRSRGLPIACCRASLRRFAGRVYARAGDPYSPARDDTPLPAFE